MKLAFQKPTLLLSFFVFLNGFILPDSFALPEKSKDRVQVGSVYSSPIQFNRKWYFVTTAGVLVEADSDFKRPKKLFEGKRQTLGAAVLHGNILIWGEGVHTDTQANLYFYDLTRHKLEKTLVIEGHVERTPLVSEGVVYVPAGPGGLQAYDLKTYKRLWHAARHDSKSVHIDSNLIQYEKSICGTTVYDLKGLICFDSASGKEVAYAPLKRNPKSEIVLKGSAIAGLATDADMVTAKFDIPADFYLYDLKENRLAFTKELRGFNFFAPNVEGDEAFVTLSTGDFILINLKSQKITFLGEFSEPFINNSFRMGSDYCAVGIAGKYHCFVRTADGTFAVSRDKRVMELVIGKVLVQNQSLILPTRMGYLKQ